jgi:hypothetical protein
MNFSQRILSMIDLALKLLSNIVNVNIFTIITLSPMNSIIQINDSKCTPSKAQVNKEEINGK